MVRLPQILAKTIHIVPKRLRQSLPPLQGNSPRSWPSAGVDRRSAQPPQERRAAREAAGQAAGLLMPGGRRQSLLPPPPVFARALRRVRLTQPLQALTIELVRRLRLRRDDHASSEQPWPRKPPGGRGLVGGLLGELLLDLVRVLLEACDRPGQPQLVRSLTDLPHAPRLEAGAAPPGRAARVPEVVRGGLPRQQT